MNKTKALIASVLLLGVLMALFLYSKGSKVKPNVVSSTPSEKTEVIKYKQTYTPEKSRNGDCWTLSIAAPLNNRAWRCTSDSNIYDPCFKTELGKIVCGVDPNLSGSGFELKLTKGLPLSKADLEKMHNSDWGDGTNNAGVGPWLIELDNGNQCSPLTGTIVIINKREFPYSCKTGVLGEIDATNPLWTSTLGHPAQDFQSFVKEERVKIVKAWE